ncbi:hypothetical protein CN324_25340 [Bacillus anthracis]|uniref:Uncharacterized protein n=6 Tax=Bacillus cereus group TaxID=86661 RepID=A0ABD7ZRE1_9BACI|nr:MULTISPECIES: hypothetical protein [Bacillus]AJH73693.1 putative membrane protein [Bacillus cereus ATCC 4342]AJI04245.1 putative membrane protein [Bacillus cereus G9241]ANN31359.1 hypothetical protein A9498_06590 [Bacillus thuringiensis serovar coreanensis]MBJ3791064.1 hypothetical protein [Bacillus sp. OA1]MDJ0281625.1 hypothetical protein [Bacillus bombysepticus]MEB4842777.1 hypothetical protein [Paenibacillus jamilae]PAW42618.1 hypothetical protein CKQ70_24240 [Bacillus toyonensis]PED
MKDTVKLLKWVTGALEALLGIPVLGGTIVVSLLWLPLLFMLVLHIVTLVLAKKANMSANGNVLGIVTSCLAWIPFVGMILHILSAIFIMMDAARKEETY